MVRNVPVTENVAKMNSAQLSAGLRAHLAEIDSIIKTCDESGLDKRDVISSAAWGTDPRTLAAAIKIHPGFFGKAPAYKDAFDALVNGPISTTISRYKARLLVVSQVLETEATEEPFDDLPDTPIVDVEGSPAGVGEATHRQMLGILRTLSPDSVIQRRNFRKVRGDAKVQSIWLKEMVKRNFLKWNRKRGAGSAYVVQAHPALQK